ncbi:DUF1566 domain-containing protein [Stenotrophomonas sp. CW117]|uniref:Lcl C-terminal domain-containing protein n=1 Tax=Stenotrophomonas TaxID=40323 RepID=UPI00178540B5|nr:DUF1566 domain-containing protein [Stenotrophomonas sp. CW117]QOF99764.1 DUF1566 domain-containing protein [Stenotrophomonas sp. CW117]
MKSLHIHVGTLNIHPISTPILAQPESIAEPFTTGAANTTTQHTKILADGTHLPAGSDRTDHVAVIDHATGLMWAVESLGSTNDPEAGISQEACQARCSELRLLGHSDWRLPTRSELAGLVDDTRHEPAIDTSLFPRVKPRWHWTSTAAAWSSASAWLVYFHDGNVDDYHRCYEGFALACRRSGQ